jgi:hypothetical protein
MPQSVGFQPDYRTASLTGQRSHTMHFRRKVYPSCSCFLLVHLAPPAPQRDRVQPDYRIVYSSLTDYIYALGTVRCILRAPVFYWLVSGCTTSPLLRHRGTPCSLITWFLSIAWKTTRRSLVEGDGLSGMLYRPGGAWFEYWLEYWLHLLSYFVVLFSFSRHTSWYIAN